MDEANPPQQRDEQGSPSDYSRYVMGDRDPAALAAKAARSRQDRAKASKAAGRGTPPGGDKRNITIPVRLNSRDAPITFRLSDREAATLDKFTASRSEFVRDLLWDVYEINDAAKLSKRAAKAGVNKSRFIRDLLLGELGIADTATRPTLRRPDPGAEIHFRIPEDAAAQLDARIEGKATRNTTAREILLDALGIQDTARRTARRRRNPTQPDKQGSKT